MQPKYQVFVSSTYEDLKDERDEVIRAVLEMNHIPVGMEMFSAADEEQWQIISRHIEESDYYVAILAHRYGSVTPEGISYTRKEYEFALSIGVPVLGFVIDPKASWPADRVDTDPQAIAKLADFKQLVAAKPIGTWTNGDDLHAKCSIALVKAFTSSPRNGWIPASSGVGPELTQELSRLSAENSALRRELEIAQRESQSERRTEFERLRHTLHGNDRQLSYRLTPTGDWKIAKKSLMQIFLILGPEMQVEVSVNDAAKALAMYCRTDDEKTSDIVAVNHVRTVFADLAALGLVTPSSRKHPVADKDQYWCLTDDGRRFLLDQRRSLLEIDFPSLDAAAIPSDESPRKAPAKKAAPRKTPAKKAAPPKRHDS